MSLSYRIATVKVEGVTPLSWSKRIPECTDKGTDKRWKHEQATWRERFHAKNGQACAPVMAFKYAMETSAKYLSVKTTGKATLTKHIRSGVLVHGDFLVPVGIKVADLRSETLFLPSNPTSNSGGRVDKIMPFADNWAATFQLAVVDTEVTEERFLQHLEHSGAVVGVGRFRPQVGGYLGRYVVSSVDWVEA